MTASYDGKLTVKRGRAEPCCAEMHEALYARAMYVSTRGDLALRLTEHRPGIVIRCCPFCGAAVDREGRA